MISIFFVEKKTALPSAFIKHVKQLDLMEPLKDHPLMLLKAIQMVYFYHKAPLAQTLALNQRLTVYILIHF